MMTQISGRSDRYGRRSPTDEATRRCGKFPLYLYRYLYIYIYIYIEEVIDMAKEAPQTRRKEDAESSPYISIGKYMSKK